MLKKIDLDYGLSTRLVKFNPADFKKEIPFAQSPDYKFIISTFSKRERYEKKHKRYSLEEAKLYFGSKKMICVLYDAERSEANIVLREEAL